MKNTQENLEQYKLAAFGIGCHLDRSASSADSLNKDTISLASHFGFDAGEMPDEESEDYSQVLSETGDEAVDYLNDLEQRDGFFWTFEENCLFLAQAEEES